MIRTNLSLIVTPNFSSIISPTRTTPPATNKPTSPFIKTFHGIVSVIPLKATFFNLLPELYVLPTVTITLLISVKMTKYKNHTGCTDYRYKKHFNSSSFTVVLLTMKSPISLLEVPIGNLKCLFVS
jgi:hypothetical protein